MRHAAARTGRRVEDDRSMPSWVVLTSRRLVRPSPRIAIRAAAGTARPYALIHLDPLALQVGLDLLGVFDGPRAEDDLLLHDRPLLDHYLFFRHGDDDPVLADLRRAPVGRADGAPLDGHLLARDRHALGDALGVDGLPHGDF